MLRYRTGTGAALLTAALLAAPLLAAGTAMAAGWTVVAIPPAGQDAFVIGLSADSGTDAWAVGTVNRPGGAAPGPLIDHWNGTAWRVATAPVYPSGDLVNLDGVSASGAADAWAVGFTETGGGGGQPFPTAAHWNGTAWNVVPPASITIGGQPVSNYLVGVADLGPADAWAVDECVPEATGFVEHWNGTAWNVVPVPDPNPVHPGMTQSLSAISAPSPDDVWAVGDYLIRTGPTSDRYETYTLHWNGTSWRVVQMPKVASANHLEAYQFNALDAISPGNVWAVGDAGVNATTTGTPSRTLIEHWNGSGVEHRAQPEGRHRAVPGRRGGGDPGRYLGRGQRHRLRGAAADPGAALERHGLDAGAEPRRGGCEPPGDGVGHPRRHRHLGGRLSGTSGSFNPLALRTTG